MEEKDLLNYIREYAEDEEIVYTVLLSATTSTLGLYKGEEKIGTAEIKYKKQKFQWVLKKAQEYFKNTDLTDENTRIVLGEKTCKKCGSPLELSPIREYTYFCHDCYEDFYRIEQG